MLFPYGFITHKLLLFHFIFILCIISGLLISQNFG
ncbi:hypothetical protein C8P63_13024 [Melghirimyces profundicolus]|uniref:Uncharacterized protein n=1 Tax=Melghirimyces profundicolus TaxID=1242148 RepID=A0A2T6B9L1_9BACL|nr:hypothetical protein C8P63_13024 [Melghirimyces profundicolus]